MTSAGSPTWRTLSAYVDGELDAAAAAAVAEAAGNEPKVAEQIAKLYRLKGATHNAFAAPAEALGRLDLTGIPPRKTPWRKRAAVAAAIALVAVLAGAGWFFVKPQRTVLPPDLLATARTLHTDWLNAGDVQATDDPPATLIAALAQFRRLPVIPDLASAKLTIDHVTLSKRSKGDVLQIGYLGTHGCHLSLFVFANGAMPGTLVRVDIGTERAYGWQVDDFGYLLLAKGMDGNRLDLIAHKVEEATHTHAPFDNRTRQALEESKRKSTSCLA